jgi:SSS family solute:Na+ symporter
MDLFMIVSILLYLGVIVLLAYTGFKRTHNSADFMLAGRQIHPVVMGLSYGATFISTSAIIGFGGTAAQFGMSLLWLTFLNIFFGVLIAFTFLGKRVRTMGQNLEARTFPELLGRRYQSRFMQIFAGAIMFVFMPVYAAAVLKGGVDFISQYFGLPFVPVLLVFTVLVSIYVLTGGMKGVMYAEAFQGCVMFCGMLFLIGWVYTRLGGVTEAHRALTELPQSAGVAEQVAGLTAIGFRGWTSMPAFGSTLWWTVVSTIIMGVGIGVLAQPQLAVRFMTVKNNRELNRAIVSGGVFILVTTGVSYVTGSLSNVIFFRDTGKVSLLAAGGSDYIIPRLINSYLPSWFGAVFLLTLLSAAMSTMSSQFHAMGTAIGVDVYQQVTGKTGHNIRTTRKGMIVGILLSAAVAWLTTFMDQSSFIIASGTSLFFGICASSFLPAYLAGLFSRTVTRRAAVASMVSGFASSLFWLLFVHQKNASNLQLCRLLTGKASIVLDTPLAKLAVVDPLVVALPVSALVLLAVGLAAKERDIADEHLNVCFADVK